MPTFAGLKNNFYTGVVEDRFDPLSLGRVRVRLYGLHTDDKKLILSLIHISEPTRLRRIS